METFLIILETVAAFLLVAATVYLIVRELRFAAFKRKLPAVPKNFTITAHTGCLGTEPNSIESMEKGLKTGASIIEFDLQFLENGKPVLSHDSPKDDAVGLDDAFSFLSKHNELKANIDVKTTAHLEKVNEYAEKYGVLDRIFFTGIFPKDVSAVERFCPKIPYYLNFSVNAHGSYNAAYISHIVETVENCGAIGINTYYKGVSKELVEAFHEKGLLVSVWTVNSRTSICKMLKLLPDNITTKYPDKIRKIMEK